eukprot:scaffold317_cov260-Pinguiococcus_pyrenoidosus.AAC.10
MVQPDIRCRANMVYSDEAKVSKLRVSLNLRQAEAVLWGNGENVRDDAEGVEHAELHEEEPQQQRQSCQERSHGLDGLDIPEVLQESKHAQAAQRDDGAPDVAVFAADVAQGENRARTHDQEVDEMEGRVRVQVPHEALEVHDIQEHLKPEDDDEDVAHGIRQTSQRHVVVRPAVRRGLHEAVLLIVALRQGDVVARDEADADRDVEEHGEGREVDIRERDAHLAIEELSHRHRKEGAGLPRPVQAPVSPNVWAHGKLPCFPWDVHHGILPDVIVAGARLSRTRLSPAAVKPPVKLLVHSDVFLAGFLPSRIGVDVVPRVQDGHQTQEHLLVRVFLVGRIGEQALAVQLVLRSAS